MKNFVLAAAVVLLSGGLFADTITGTSTAGATTLTGVGAVSGTAAWINNATDPYGAGNIIAPNGLFWNNPSDDAITVTAGAISSVTSTAPTNNVPPTTQSQHMANIGYLLTDTGAFAGTPSVLGSDTVSHDYQNTNGSDPTSFSFVRTATAENISMLFASSNYDGTAAGTTQIGYFVGSTYIPGGGGNGTVLWNSVTQEYTPGGNGGTSTFNPSGNYGFFAVVCPTGQACYTLTTNGNTGTAAGAAYDHFAAFKTTAGNWVIAFTSQNGLFGEGQGDFQDVVFEISAAATPEPGTIAILGLGLAGLGILGRRRFAK